MADWRDRAQTDGDQQPADRPPRAQGARAGRLAALAIAGIAALAPLAHAQLIRSPEAVPSGQPIPKDFKTWSLFLVCNPAWLGDGAAAKARMTTLHGTFLGFGHSLGTRNAAVWFTTANGPAVDFHAELTRVFHRELTRVIYGLLLMLTSSFSLSPSGPLRRLRWL